MSKQLSTEQRTSRAALTPQERRDRKIQMTREALTALGHGAEHPRRSLFGPRTHHADSSWQLGIIRRLIAAGVVERTAESNTRYTTYKCIGDLAVYEDDAALRKLVDPSHTRLPKPPQTGEQTEEQTLVKTNSDGYIDPQPAASGDDVSTDELLKSIVMWCNHLDDRFDELDARLEKITKWLSCLAE